MRNVFFTHGTRNEQFLQQGLVEEYIKMFGMDVLYIPRQLTQKDGVFNEEVSSEFDDSYLIEAYLENAEGFQGGGDLLTKFGIRQTDEITMVISQQRFSDLISQFLLLDTDVELGERPQEGDLIWFPLAGNYFEIKFVEHEEPFYQLGKNYTYKLKCELFEYSDEQGEIFIGDEELVDTGYTIKYYFLTSAGVSAIGVPTLLNGGISSPVLTEEGKNYNFTPTVTVNGDGTGAEVRADMITVSLSGSTPLRNAVLKPTTKEGKLIALEIVDGGEGYDVARTGISFSNPPFGGLSPVAKPTFDSNGTLIGAEITNQGKGYTSVSKLVVEKPGSGYTTASFTIQPVSPGRTGDFKIGESVTGGSTGNQAVLADWDAKEGWLKLKAPTGDFLINEILMGSDTGSQVTINSFDPIDSTDDKYYDNVEFELEADDILDFSESNPFGIAT